MKMNTHNCWTLALLTALCFLLHSTEGASLHRDKRGGNPRGRMDRWFDWPCPQLICPSTEGCAVIEVVMWVHGARLCEGCPYCLDSPPRSLGLNIRGKGTSDERSRRSIRVDRMPIEQNGVCRFASCPLERPSRGCSQPSVLDGYFHGDKCISCAFCSDDVIRNSQDGRLH